jgi:hypothetical protein
VIVETDRLVGFCLLIRRGLIDKVGLLDERFGIGCFEDDDYCLRARQAGYRAVMARDAFIHHHGGATFQGSGVDFAAVMRKNEQVFRAKWEAVDGRTVFPNRPDGLGKPSHGALLVTGHAGGGLVLARKEIQLSVCIIARDNARTIAPCVESIRRWADEVIVVDTGS